MSEFGLKFPVLIDDRGYPASNQYGLTNVPTVFLIAPDGKIQVSAVGFSKPDLEDIAAAAATRDWQVRDSAVQTWRSDSGLQAWLRLEELGSVRACSIESYDVQLHSGLDFVFHQRLLMLRRPAALVGDDSLSGRRTNSQPRPPAHFPFDPKTRFFLPRHRSLASRENAQKVKPTCK